VSMAEKLRPAVTAVAALRELTRACDPLNVALNTQEMRDRIEAAVDRVRQIASKLDAVVAANKAEVFRARIDGLKARCPECLGVNRPTALETAAMLTQQVVELLEPIPAGPQWYEIVVKSVWMRLGNGQALSALQTELELERQLCEERQEADAQPEAQEAEFVFARDGSMWFIRGFGAEGHFESMRGFEYIAQLLRAYQNAPKGTFGGIVPMTELVADVVPSQPIKPASGDVAADREALRSCHKRLEELDAELVETRKRGDLGCLEALEKEKQQLQGYLSQGTRKLGDEIDKLRVRIANNLKVAYKKLRQGKLDQLAWHLESSISAEGATYIYRPADRPQWIFSKQSLRLR